MNTCNVSCNLYPMSEACCDCKHYNMLKQLEQGLLRECDELINKSFSKDVKSFAKSVRKYIELQRKKGLQFRIGKPEKLKFEE